MISSSSRWAASPLAFSALRTRSAICPSSNCTGERLTAMVSWLGQAAATSQALRITQSPISVISPSRSAIGTKTVGEICPPPSFGRRSRASNPASRPVGGAMDRLERKLERLVGDRLPEHRLELALRLQLRVHLRAEQAARRRALVLRVRERGFGVLQKAGRILAVRRRNRTPDADRDLDVAVVQMKRLAEAAMMRSRRLGHLRHVAHDLGQRELVAAERRASRLCLVPSACSRRATCLRISSPAAAPSVSLMSLKRLMSTVCTTTGQPRRIASSRSFMKRARFRISVSASCCARKSARESA